MIKYGLKLWSSNDNLFKEALSLFEEKKIDFIELYHNAREALDYEKLEILKKVPIMIHNTHDCGFHEFEIGREQLDIWKKTKQLANFFGSPFIVIHSGKARSLDAFRDNLKKIDDPRILIENMPGLDLYGDLTFGYSLKELKKIRKIKKICFDLEKAVKSACYQEIDYKKFIQDCLKQLEPFYFHISGGDMTSSKDEHLNLQESNFDLMWMKKELDMISKNQDVSLVFEVPKNNNLENDMLNMTFLREI